MRTLFCQKLFSRFLGFAVATILIGRGAVWEMSAHQLSERIAQAASNYRWVVADKDALSALFADAATVKNVLNTIENNGKEPSLEIVSSVKEYRLADLHDDGALELVAIVDQSGRGFFNAILIVSREPDVRETAATVGTIYHGLVLREVRGFEIETLASALKDLDGDGVLEIIIPNLIEPYHGGAEPHAMLPDIYGWNGKRYENRNAKYGWYFRDVVLPRLTQQADELDTSSRISSFDAERNEASRRRAAVGKAIDEAKRRAQPQR